ncbi:MAG: ribosome silencing factor [Planctomycetaceae bacterium]
MAEQQTTQTQEVTSGIRRAGTIEAARENACLVAKVCADFRGQNTIVIDTTGITPLFDFFVITTGVTRRQNNAIANTSDDVMLAQGSKRLGTEGMETGWICHDYGDVVLHVFTPESRQKYDLENLWADAPRVDWSKAAE